MDETINFYEVAYMLKEIEAEADILALVAGQGGIVKFKQSPVLRELAYPIKKRTSAFFGYLQCEMLRASVAPLKRALGLAPAVLRSLIVASPPRIIGGIQEKAKEFTTPLAEKPKPKPDLKPEPARETVLSNEALEARLEEILK